jgi:hypothetical protein
MHAHAPPVAAGAKRQGMGMATRRSASWAALMVAAGCVAAGCAPSSSHEPARKAAETPPAAPAPVPVLATRPDGGGFRFDRSRDLHPALGGSPTGVGEARLQPQTGARIRRIAAGGLVVYSRYTPSSIDNRLLVVHGEDSTSARIVDLATGDVVRELPEIGEVNEIRWHYGLDAPSRFYYVDGMQFRQMDARTGRDELVRDFSDVWPAGSQLYTDVEGDSSNDSRYWCWMVRREVEEGSWPVELLVSYDRVAGTLATADAARLGRAEMGRPNTIEASPGGTACVVHWGADEGRPQAWARDFSTKLRDVAVDETHSGWILDDEGGEWFVSQNNRSDWIEAVDLRSGRVRQLLHHGDLGWNNGMHFSRDYAATGHVLLSTYSAGSADWGDNQLVLLGLDGRFVRVAHTHSAYPGNDGYRNEAAAAMSHDGQTIYWTANWGDGSAVRDVYAVGLPEAWWTQ